MIIELNEDNIKDTAKVYMDSWKESHKAICSPEFIEKHNIDYMTEFLKKKKENGYAIFIDYVNEKPVGMVGINPLDEEICLLYVSPDEQRKGYGSELFEFALSRCENPYITVLDTNIKAIEFYTKRGFVPAEKQPENSFEKHIFERKYVYQNKNM